jgi:hypothetical protein
LFANIPPELDLIISQINELTVGMRFWLDIFEYRYERVVEHHEQSMSLMRFLSSAHFMVFTGSIELGEDEPISSI